jgi:hypothetical protein
MKVQKQHLYLAGAALVLAVGWSIYSFSRPAVRPAQPPIPDQQESMRISPGRGGGAQPAASVVQTVDPMTIPAPPSVGRTNLSLATRDPFLFGNESRDVREALILPPSVEPPQDPTLPLVKTILVSASRRVALVENTMVSVGDKIGELTVTQIDRDGVTFQLPSGERKKVNIHSSAGSAGVIR